MVQMLYLLNAIRNAPLNARSYFAHVALSLFLSLQWDGFVSCFFVDTAPNVLEFIQLVHKLLKPGAVWLNHGPLTYHFADAYSELSEPGWLDERYHESIELSWEELRHALGVGGFRIEEEVTDLPSHYTLNEK
jgi:hypothetical protein